MTAQILFRGGTAGDWTVTGMQTLRGAGLAPAARLSVALSEPDPGSEAAWTLRGAVSHLRYTTRGEAEALRAVQEPLGRGAATCAALIPIAKSAAWWDLAQDERRAIFEETSHHTAIGLAYLPAIARRLHHARDLGEPFDFLTWFEFAPADAPAFDALVAALRATREWDYVAREVDIRLFRADAAA